jgi:hypothetical protein
MKLRNAIHNNHGKTGLLKRLGIVVGAIVLIVAAVQLISYITRPQIQYSLKEANCSSAAIAARNKTLGADLKSCVLAISAKNLQDKSVYIDYDGVGGGPAGGGNPLIRINTNNDTFCYVALAGEGASFTPKATNNLTLRCAQIPNPPKNYDMASDTNPTSIIVAGYSKTTINVDPVR